MAQIAALALFPHYYLGENTHQNKDLFYHSKYVSAVGRQIRKSFNTSRNLSVTKIEFTANLFYGAWTSYCSQIYAE